MSNDRYHFEIKYYNFCEDVTSDGDVLSLNLPSCKNCNEFEK